MKNPRFYSLLLCSLTLIACSSKDDASKKLKRVEIAEIGVSVEVPVDWELSKNMDRYYGLKGPDGTQVQIIGSVLSGGGALDDVAKECQEKVLQKEMLPGGAYFVLCEGSQAGQKSKTVKVNLGTGEKTSVRCQWETVKDPSAIAKVCKTLKKI